MERLVPLAKFHVGSGAALAALLLVAVTGCSNPYKTAAKMGARLVGQSIEDKDVQAKGKALVGRPATAADEAFGQPVDVWKDVARERTWRSYPVQLDVLGKQRYVVAVSDEKIVAVSKAEKSDRKLDIPRAILLKEKVKGKSPQETESNLQLGRPVLAARSLKTNRLVQLYDAGSMTDMGKPHYCIVRYGGDDKCEDLEFLSVGASTRGS